MQKELVHEQVKEEIKHEHFNKPLIEKTEVAQPIVEKIVEEREVRPMNVEEEILPTNLGQETLVTEKVVTEEGILENPELNRDVIMTEGMSPETRKKKGFGTKLKELFVGKHHHHHHHGE